jgi:aminoglycoside phosphotransferase (APT) family kinase protein
VRPRVPRPALLGDGLTAGPPPGQPARQGPKAEPPASELARLHGYELTAAERTLLRSDPPASALAWCEAVAGGQVAAFRALDGGMSSAVHAVDLADGRALVLRRYVREDWLAEEPGVPRREATALELLEDRPLPTPQLVAVDPDGGDAGDPAVLMTRLAGAIDWAPAHLDAFLAGLAALLPHIHATPVVAGLPDYSPYALEAFHPPPWSTRPEVWERGFAVFDGPPPGDERVFIHRDFHPGNVLWQGGAVSGVVDWANASVGAPEADIGHCRMNLAGVFGLEAADRFLELCGAGVGYDPYWDIVAALGGFDAATLARWTPVEEEFLARAVVRL